MVSLLPLNIELTALPLSSGRHRIVIFSVYSNFISNYLVETLLKILSGRDDVQACMLVLTDRERPRTGLKSTAFFFVRSVMLKLFNRDDVFRLDKYWRSNLLQIAAPYGIEVVWPDKQNINSPTFVERIERWQPTVGFSLVCPQIMRRALIDRFQHVINYHNGLLEHYRGVYSTEWSLYNREPQTGFSYHLIDEGIDSGPVLVEGSISASSICSTTDIEIEKTKRARELLEKVVQSVLSRDFVSNEAATGGTYYNLSKTQDFLLIDRPELLTAEEVLRRLKAFGHLRIRCGDRLFDNVTAVRVGLGRLSFTTQDAKVMKIHRISGRPIWLENVLKFVRRR